MRVAIRTDASAVMGTGHVMRCLCLASAIKASGGHVEFICRSHPGHLGSYVQSKGFDVHLIPPGNEATLDGLPHASWLGSSWVEDAEGVTRILAERPPFDWLVVDHYALDARWERKLRPTVPRLMAIDDLADRPHDCDLLLDQNLQPTDTNRYEPLVSSTCRVLLGPRYALLRPEFREARARVRERAGTVERVHVYFGGADVEDLTTRTVRVLARLGIADTLVEVFVGASNPRASEVRALCEHLGFTVYGHSETIAEAMTRSDLAIGAAGSSVWERCAVGLPAVTVGGAANQEVLGILAAREGVCAHMGPARSISDACLSNAVRDLMTDAERRADMSRKGLQLVDGLGVSRVMHEMAQTTPLSDVPLRTPEGLDSRAGRTAGRRPGHHPRI